MKKLKVCDKGHRFYKSSDCPVCPQCEKEHIADAKFLSLIAAPARRALERIGVNSVEKLSQFSEKEILEQHGMGPSTIPKLKKALKDAGLSFKK